MSDLSGGSGQRQLMEIPVVDLLSLMWLKVTPLKCFVK